MTEIYIDFDGVIVDTWNLIYNEYKKKYKTTEINEKDNVRFRMEFYFKQ